MFLSFFIRTCSGIIFITFKFFPHLHTLIQTQIYISEHKKLASKTMNIIHSTLSLQKHNRY